LLLVLWIVPYVFASINKTDVNHYMYPLWIGMTIVVYWLAWSMFSRRDLFEYTPPEILEPEEIIVSAISAKAAQPNEKKEKPVPLSWEQHYRELTRLMEEEKLYLDFDISMSSLAQKMGLSNGYLSQIINQKEGQNFYDYINTYRVKAVVEKLSDAASAHLSMYGIALDCGFKSKSTFNAVFKKVTGKTPSEYKNDLQTASGSVKS
jgi:AraC-like DNA-binding protein